MPNIEADTVQEALDEAEHWKSLAENEQELIDVGYDPVWHGAEKARCMENYRQYMKRARELYRQEKMQEEVNRSNLDREMKRRHLYL